MFDHLRTQRRPLLSNLPVLLAAIFFAALFAAFPVAALDLEQRSVAAQVEARAQRPTVAAGQVAFANDEIAMLDRCRDLLGLDSKSDVQAVDCARGHDDSPNAR